MFGLLSPKVWLYVGIAALVAAYTGGVYYAGGAAPRAELVKLKNEVVAAQKLAEAQDAKKTVETKAAILKLEGERNANALSRDTAWATYHRLLKSNGSRPKPAAKPTRITSNICNSADEDQRLSDAVQRYRDEVRSGLDDLWRENQQRRFDTSVLIEQCEKQTADLDDAKTLIIELQKINRSSTN